MRWWLVLLLVLPAWAQPYRNPVLPLDGPEIADPYVLKYNGEYYLYASGDPVNCWHSVDLVRWDSLGPVLRSTPGTWNEADVWAPEVVYRNGKFLMYYTASRKSTDWRVNEMARRVGVAVSDSPTGPFVDVGRPLTPGWAIDGTVLLDPLSGLDWLFYSRLQEPDHPGAGIFFDKFLAWDKVAGKPALAIQGTEAWEDKDGDPTDGGLRYTNEGPTMVARGGRYYLLYSGGSWDMPTYAVGAAVASQPEGPWKKLVPPFLRATPLVDGPGHNCVTVAPNNVDDIQVYHARPQPYVDPWNRLPFVDRLFWHGERPWCEQPSLGWKSAPDRPLVEDRFDGGLGLWKGDGEVVGGELLLRGGRLELKERFPSDCVVEVNLATSERAGIALENLTVEIDAKGKQLIIGDRHQAERPADAVRFPIRPRPPEGEPLPPGFKPEVYHQLVITVENAKASDDTCTLTVLLDGVLQRRLGLSVPWRGTLAVTGSGRFDGLALTQSFSDDFRGTLRSAGHAGIVSPAGDHRPSDRGWQTTGTWNVADGLLHQTSAVGLATATRGAPLERYEFSAALRPLDPSPPLVAEPGPTDLKWKAGVTAVAGDKVITAGYDKAIWPLAHFWVERREGGKVTQTLSAGLPRGFRYDVFHTLRTVRDGDRFTFYVDGRETIATSFPGLPPTAAGLFTENVAADFDDVSWKRIMVPLNSLLDGSFECNSAWVMSHGARPNESQPHSGLRRLLLPGLVAEGVTRPSQAVQTVTLEPGSYRLHSFVCGSGTVALSLAGQKASAAVTADWRPLDLTVEVSAAGPTEVVIQGTGGAAVDDVYLEATLPR